MLTKTRHNKKRNTAFIYEALVRELTKCVVDKEEGRKEVVVSIIKSHFKKGSPLREELDLYKVLYEAEDLEAQMCERLISEVKRSHDRLNKEEVFQEQTAIINKINKSLSKSVFTNFVPNYKDLATIAQILNPDVSVKHRVLLESNLAQALSVDTNLTKAEMAPIDNLVYKTFVKKFNDQYEGKLFKEQEDLLSRYITSFHDNGLELKIFLNEEFCRLKGLLNDWLKAEELAEDDILRENTIKVLSVLDTYKDADIDAAMIQQVLNIQSLAEELNN